MGIFGWKKRNVLGVSLGSCNTFIYKRGKGIVSGEPSYLTIDAFTEKNIAFGLKAKNMRGRVPETVSVICPIRNGTIADFKKTVDMLSFFIERVVKNRWGLEMVVSVPAAATVVERRAVRDAARAAYGSHVDLIDEPIAAAIGCGLDVFSQEGFMIVDIGGGSTEISVISSGQVVRVHSLPQCGNLFDKDIINYVRKSYNILIGDSTAESVKCSLGSVADNNSIDFVTLNGRDVLQGLPVSFVLSSVDVRDAIADSVHAIIEGIVSVLEKLPTELNSDVVRNKIYLVGGGALLWGWKERIFSDTGVEVIVADNPMECVAVGAGHGLNILGRLRKNQRNYEQEGLL